MNRLGAIVFAACVFAGLGPVDGTDVAGTVGELKRLLAAYDRAGGGDTIPIEQAIVVLRDAHAIAELAPFLGHQRFGFEVAWALGEVGDASSVKAIVAAFQATDANGRAEMGLHLGAFRTDEARAALHSWFDSADEKSKELARVALLRAGDPAVEKEALAGLASKDAAACAKALLLVGNGRREDLLERVAALAKDARPVPGDLKSKFGVTSTTKGADGSTTETTTYPELKTVGAVAIEAASRAVSPTTPEITAWWYEVELQPRFAATADGLAFLRAYVQAARAAATAKAPRAREAVASVLRALKATNEDARARLTGIEFKDGWVLRFRVAASMGAEPGEERSATVDRSGKVKLD